VSFDLIYGRIIRLSNMQAGNGGLRRLNISINKDWWIISLFKRGWTLRDISTQNSASEEHLTLDVNISHVSR